VLIDFSDRSQLASLRSAFRLELKGLSAELTRSERAALLDQLCWMLEASNPAPAQQAFDAYRSMLSQLRSNSFRTEALTQKSEAAADAGTEQILRGDLARVKVRVEYFSRFGNPGGGAFLTLAEATLLKGYLDRAEARLHFYAARQGDAPAAVLTALETADVSRALAASPIPETPQRAQQHCLRRSAQSLLDGRLHRVATGVANLGATHSRQVSDGADLPAAQA
jgi:hypothetical protein